MNLLVTGGAGYIGSNVAGKLIDQGHTVTVVDDLSTGFIEAIDLKRCVGYEINIKDDFEALRYVIEHREIDTVFHFAARSIVADSVNNPLYYYRENIDGILYLLEACVGSSVKRFILSSTAAVYGSTIKIPIAESAPLLPINPYGSSKLSCELILRDVAKMYGIKYAILRYFNVAGRGQRSKKATHLIKVASEYLVGKRDRLEIFGQDYETHDGTCVRDYIHVDDLAEAHLFAMRYLACGEPSDTFNCGYGVGYSVLEVIDSLERVSGKKIERVFAPRRPGDPATLIADSRKIIETLGWTPRFNNLDEITKSAYDWELKLSANEFSSGEESQKT